MVLDPADLLQGIRSSIAIGSGRRVESLEPGLGWAKGLGLEHH